jgi:hypothetical protein
MTQHPAGEEREQLELQDELDAAEGFDGWDVFDLPEDDEEPEAA